MSKTSKKTQIKNNPPAVVSPTPQPDPAKGDVMELEEKAEENKEEIQIEEEKNTNQEKQNGATYNLDDIEIKKISLDKNICVRIINNINGTFVDIRKYYKGYPTKRGIRFSTFMFKKIIEYLKEDLK